MDLYELVFETKGSESLDTKIPRTSALGKLHGIINLCSISVVAESHSNGMFQLDQVLKDTESLQ